MATYLGAALEMKSDELAPEIFAGYDCLYVEGYLVQDHALIRRAMQLAKECGLKVAIDLASFNIVEENLDFLRGLVEEYVDILFANEQEATVFTGESDPAAAVEVIARVCELTVVKIGIRGAYIRYQGETLHVGIMAAAKRVDTTGAGDSFHAGFEFQYLRTNDLMSCARFASAVSGLKCGRLGARAGLPTLEQVETFLANQR